MAVFDLTYGKRSPALAGAMQHAIERPIDRVLQPSHGPRTAVARGLAQALPAQRTLDLGVEVVRYGFGCGF